MEGGQGGMRALMTSLEEHLPVLVMLSLAIPTPHATAKKGDKEKKTVPDEAADTCKGRGKHDEQSSMVEAVPVVHAYAPKLGLNHRHIVHDRLIELYLVPSVSMVDDCSVSINVLSVRTDRGPCGNDLTGGEELVPSTMVEREKGGYFWRGEEKRLKGEHMKGKRRSTWHEWLVVVQMIGQQWRLWACGCAVGFRGDMFNGYHTVRDGFVELYFASDVSIGVLSVHVDQGPHGGPVVLGSRQSRKKRHR
uniref:Uncharacterized protein n=1 Tax=Oryza meridionalis TaxID=40149 RepID=A0A0E0EM64_9ORYZ